MKKKKPLAAIIKTAKLDARHLQRVQQILKSGESPAYQVQQLQEHLESLSHTAKSYEQARIRHRSKNALMTFVTGNLAGITVSIFLTPLAGIPIMAASGGHILFHSTYGGKTDGNARLLGAHMTQTRDLMEKILRDNAESFLEGTTYTQLSNIDAGLRKTFFAAAAAQNPPLKKHNRDKLEELENTIWPDKHLFWPAKVPDTGA